MNETKCLHKIIIFFISLLIISPATAQGLSWCQHHETSVAGHFVMDNNGADSSHDHHNAHAAYDPTIQADHIEFHCHGCIHIPVSQNILSQPTNNTLTHLTTGCLPNAIAADNVSFLPATEISTRQLCRDFHFPDCRLSALRTLILQI